MGTAQPKEFSSYPRIHCCPGLWPPGVPASQLTVSLTERDPWASPDFLLPGWLLLTSSRAPLQRAWGLSPHTIGPQVV